jgi:hypothetical protein
LVEVSEPGRAQGLRELQRLSTLAAEHTQLYLQYLEVAARLGREMQDVSLRAQAALCRSGEASSEGEAGCAMPAEAQPTVAELEEGRQALSDWQVRKTLCSRRARSLARGPPQELRRRPA